MSRHDSLDDVVLRFGNQVEECLMVDWGPVFAEDKGRGGARDSHLVWIYWIASEPSIRLRVRVLDSVVVSAILRLCTHGVAKRCRSFLAGFCNADVLLLRDFFS